MWNTLIATFFAAAIAVGTYLGIVSPAREEPKPQPLRFVSEVPMIPRFGSVVTAKFPGSLNTFAEGDVIEEEDWNAIEVAIGTTTSTVTSTLSYQVRSTSQLNPGHKHDSDAVSGTISIAKGGTATSTTPSAGQVLVGDGTGYNFTNAIPNCVNTTTSLHYTSSTRTWACDTATFVDTTSDQTINGVKTFGSIPVLPASNPTTGNQATRKTYVDTEVGWSLQSSSTIAAGPIASTSVTGIIATNQLMLIAIYGLSNGASQVGMQFNNDTAGNYGGTVAGGTSCALAAAGSASNFYVSGVISNQSNIVKVANFQVTKYNGTSTISTVSVGCAWSNAANSITSVKLIDFGASAMGDGYIKVYGRN